MIDFNKLLPASLYHAYVIEGDRDAVTHELKTYFDKSDNTNKIDFFCRTYDAFTIDDSTSVKEWHSIRNNNDAKKICILGFHFINHDAERTLLKMLEEPKDNTYFFLVTPNSRILLDTILSRVHVVKIAEGSINKNPSIDVDSFLKSSITVRLEKIAELIKSHKEIDDGSGGLRNEATLFVNKIEDVVYNKWQKDKNTDSIEILEIIKNSRHYLSIPGCSPKMILEQIVLVL